MKMIVKTECSALFSALWYGLRQIEHQARCISGLLAICGFVCAGWTQAAPVYECKEKNIISYSDKPCANISKQAQVDVGPGALGWKSLGNIENRSYYVHFSENKDTAHENRIVVFYNLKSPGLIAVNRGIVNGGKYLSAREIIDVSCQAEELNVKRSAWYSERNLQGLLVAESYNRGYSESGLPASSARHADFLLTTICKLWPVPSISRPVQIDSEESDCIGDDIEGC